jgi:hypothetical protein
MTIQRTLCAFSILVVAASCGPEPDTALVYHAYRVPPRPDRIERDLPPGKSGEDPFPEERMSLPEVLRDIGVTFEMPGSRIITGFPVSAFGMWNTPKNHEILTSFLNDEFGTTWSYYIDHSFDSRFDPDDPFSQGMANDR